MTSEDYTTVVDYLKCVSFGMIMGWLETGMNPNAMARFRRILELKCGDLEHLIDRCEKNAVIVFRQTLPPVSGISDTGDFVCGKFLKMIDNMVTKSEWMFFFALITKRRQHENRKNTSEFDGLGLEIAVIVPEGNPKGVIQFSHGMAEHKERYYDFMNYLSDHGYVCYS